jgi:hypothetical protein
VNEFSKRGVPLHIGLPVTAFEAPFDLLRDEVSANPVKVGEHSIDPEPYRVCRLLCLSKTDVKLYGLRELWREKGVLPKEIPGIWHSVFFNFEVAITKRYREFGRVNQIYHDPQYVISRLIPSSPLCKYYPLVELDLHQIRLLFYGAQSPLSDQNAPNGHQKEGPVCPHWLEYFFAPRSLFRLAIGTGAWPGKADSFSSSRSGLLRLCGTLLTVVLIGLGLICLFWDRLKENADKQREDETRLHSSYCAGV